VLWFERNGFCMLYKRLHGAVFELPAAGTGSAAVHIDGAALAKLLVGVPRERRQLLLQLNDNYSCRVGAGWMERHDDQRAFRVGLG